MRAGVYTGVENLKLQEWPKPELNPGEMLVKVQYAGICGTDMMIHAGKHPRVVPPRVLGHEIFGTVVEANSPGESKIREGDRLPYFP